MATETLTTALSQIDTLEEDRWAQALRLLSGRGVRLAFLAAIYFVTAHVLPAPAEVAAAGWRVTAVFLATIAGLMLRPVAGAPLVVMGLTLMVLVGDVPLPRALAGFSTSSVWLVLTAMLMARTLQDTGVARRIALTFVGLFGRTSLGLSYALMMSEVTLSAGIPSITARSGCIVLPITRGIAELYGSRPGASAPQIGRFLMTSVYQCSVVACAMFLTGQAGNLLAASMAAKFAGVEVTWSSWFAAAIVPGAISCAVIPWLVYHLVPPVITQTPAATVYARSELRAMGRVRRTEAIAAAVFVIVIALWVTSAWHGRDVALVALAGLGVLILTNTLSWDTALAERPAWDVFIWYGGLLTMGDLLADTGSTRAFAAWVVTWLEGVALVPAMLTATLVYFFAHYAMASITTHILTLFAPFVVLMMGLGAPPALAVYGLACLANLTAGLTHYGTTTGPIIFAQNYVGLADWWRVGLAAAVVNLVIWLTCGLWWWKWLGLW